MTKNILLLVEGENTEVGFFNNLSDNFLGECNLKIVSFKCNIYALYKYISEFNFDIDIIKALLLSNDILTDEDKVFIKSNNFIRKFLVFDFDFQEKFLSDTEKANRLRILKKYFNNETDQGLLLINYPMFESIKEPFASINKYDFNLNYKQLINKRGIKYDLFRLSRERIETLIINSIILQNFIINKLHSKPSYHELQKSWYNLELLEIELNEYLKNKEIYCINTSVQLPSIYFGDSLYGKL